MKFKELLDNLLKEEYAIDSLDDIVFYIKFLEGTIPHIHFRNKNRTIDGAIRLDVPEYFPHGGKYKSKLNKKQKNYFLNMLDRQSSKYKDMTVWHQLCKDWNKNVRDGNKINYIEDNLLKRRPLYENYL